MKLNDTLYVATGNNVMFFVFFVVLRWKVFVSGVVTEDRQIGITNRELPTFTCRHTVVSHSTLCAKRRIFHTRQGIPSCSSCQVAICPLFPPLSSEERWGGEEAWEQEMRDRDRRSKFPFFLWQIKKSINHCRPLTVVVKGGLPVLHRLFMKLSSPSPSL